ncbi:F0F1 ATP synthase subunit epsilon [Marinicellulosiphila megalodicopiae]|uniref:F0F1 ATP synthase subunit epsilon n=1 Tax=Marinicellulosiphila megalodicopiae TaxID=2724896 RepID=UPI003BB07BEC
MAKTVLCDIVSAEELIFSGPVEVVVVTGEMGELGIRPGHAPLLTGIKPGHVRINVEGEEKLFFVSGGYIEIQPKHVTILADTAIRAADLDKSAAQKAKQEAEDALSGKAGKVNYDEATAKLAMAMAQLKVLAEIRSHR